MTHEQLANSGVEATYELPQDEKVRLCEELFTRLPLDTLPEDQSFLSVEVGPDSPYSNLARAVEVEVFLETFGNTPDIMQEQYGPYEDASRFWIVFDKASRAPVGALRAIGNSEAGLKTLNDIESPPLSLPKDKVVEACDLDLDKTWDIGTVAVLEGYRGIEHDFIPSLTLYRDLYRRSIDLGIEDFIAVIDKGARRNLDLMGLTFKPILDSEAFSYLDSPESWALHSKTVDLGNGAAGLRDSTAEKEDGISQLLHRSAKTLVEGTRVDDSLVILD